MITAQDIREKTFEKSTFGGYAMGEVDDYLDELANDLAASQKETAELRSKMKVLVEKIAEYRESEEAMHLALVSAQKVAKTIQAESQAEAETILSSARAEAEAILSSARAEAEAVTGTIKQQRAAEEQRLEQARAAAEDYVRRFRMVLAQESAFLDSLADSDFVSGVIVTPAPEAAPALAAFEDELPAIEEDTAPEIGEVELEPDEPAEDSFDYVEAFEKAVFGNVDDTIPEADDGDDLPSFKF